MIHGADVSNWQGAFTWRNKGLKFGFAKATEGTNFSDGQFPRNWKQMKTHGLVRGAYHFAHPKNSAIAEADYFLGKVRAQGLHAGDLLALDLEVSDGKSAAHVAAFARSWCKRVHAETGIRPIVYTFLSFGRGGYCAGLGGYPLWIADPSSPAGKPRIAGPWKSWAIHQYSDSPFDKDVSHLTVAQLRELGGDDVSAEEVWDRRPEHKDDLGRQWQMGTYDINTNVVAHKILAGQAELMKKAGVQVDVKALAAELIPALDMETLAALIKQGLAADVVTDLKNRL